MQNNVVSQEDEIDLRELARTIGRHKKKLILFSLSVTIMALIWSLSKPNTYQSQAVLVLQGQSKSMGALGGLGALAGMAGVDLGGGEMSADQAYQLYLDDYQWMRKFLLDTKLFDRLNAEDAGKNYRFAMGMDSIHQWLKVKPESKVLSAEEEEGKLFKTYQIFQKNLLISSDKKTSMITIAYSDPDPLLAKDAVEHFIRYASVSLRQNELSDMDKKITYYNEELVKTNDLALKTQLSTLMSALIQKKVLAQASDLYNVKQIIRPSVAYEKDKEGPKRGLIVVVSFVASIIMGIFGIFLLEFLRKKPIEEGV